MTSHGPATKKRTLSLVLAVIVALGVMFVLPVRAMAASSDASLLKVAGYTITPGSETGADAANAITAAITVPNATLSIADTDLVAADAATVNLYTENTYTTEAPVTLVDGANELYIKVTAENGTEAYYHVTATRVDGNVPVITTTQADIPYAMQGLEFGYGGNSSIYITAYITATNSPTTYTLTGTLPSGLSLYQGDNDSLGGYISWIRGTPTAIESATLSIIATNISGNSAPFEFTLEVRADDRHTVGFGGKEWLVTSEAATRLTLLQKNYTSGENTTFGDNNNYSGSTLQTAMNAAAGALSADEKSLIVAQDFAGNAVYNDNSDAVAGAPVTGALYWPLSVNEANALTIYERPYGSIWWLRSPGNSLNFAAVVNIGGAVFAPGYDVDLNGGVRPAFHLNLQSALFTSAATGGKSGAVGPDLVAAQPPANFYKFTMTTTDTAFLSLNVADTSTRTAAQGGSVTIPYTGAQTGADKYASCIITDAGGNVLYYGKLATAASGNAVINIPSNMQTGDYTIKLFNEQINGDNYTDFASTPVEIPLTVELGYTISGTITGSDAPGGLAATVQLQQNGGNVGSAVTANADGTYTITGVPAGTGYTITASMGGYTAGTTASFDVSGDVTGQDLVLQKTTGTNPDLFAPTNHSGITYTNRTLTDTPTGVTVAGRMTGGAKLTVRERVLHLTGACSACDEIRERQAAGEVIVLYDIALSGGNMGELMVSIPVGSQYDGQTLTILHCNNGKLESVSATVTGGMATGLFNNLSPFAVVGEMRVAVPGEVVQDAPKTGDNPFAWVGAVLVLCAALALNRKLKKDN